MTPSRIVPIGQLKEAAKRVAIAHGENGFVVLSGPSGVGKTTCAAYIVDQINQGRLLDEHARAVTFEVSGKRLATRMQQTVRGPLRAIYTFVLGPVPSTLFQRQSEHEVCRKIVAAMRARGTQVLLLDEAGSLAAEEMRGLAMLMNVAREEGWLLTIVLIGMDELPKTVTSLPQLETRVIQWVWYEPLDQDDWDHVVRELLPEFRGAKFSSIRSWSRRQFGGTLRDAIKWIRHLRQRAEDSELEMDQVDLEFCKAVLEDLLLPQQLMIEAHKRGFRGASRAT